MSTSILFSLVSLLPANRQVKGIRLAARIQLGGNGLRAGAGRACVYCTGGDVVEADAGGGERCQDGRGYPGCVAVGSD